MSENNTQSENRLLLIRAQSLQEGFEEAVLINHKLPKELAEANKGALIDELDEFVKKLKYDYCIVTAQTEEGEDVFMINSQGLSDAFQKMMINWYALGDERQNADEVVAALPEHIRDLRAYQTLKSPVGIFKNPMQAQVEMEYLTPKNS